MIIPWVSRFIGSRWSIKGPDVHWQMLWNFYWIWWSGCCLFADLFMFLSVLHAQTFGIGAAVYFELTFCTWAGAVKSDQSYLKQDWENKQVFVQACDGFSFPFILLWHLIAYGEFNPFCVILFEYVVILWSFPASAPKKSTRILFYQKIQAVMY